MRRSKLAFGFLTLTTLAIACSLDLDEKLIATQGDGGSGRLDANLPDGTVISESGVPVTPEPIVCSRDEECVSANGCLKGKCDLTRRACAYDICRANACSVGTCDQNTKACGGDTPYKRVAGELTLDQPLAGAVVAAYPWLFQITNTGLLAYDVSNPTKSRPTQVPIVGLGFVPAQMIRAGNRLWLLAGLTGSPARLPIAYIDVPPDPFTTRIEARTILASYNRPAGEPVSLLPSSERNAFVIGAQPSYPTALLDTLLAEPATKTATEIDLPGNSVVIGTSGNRLLTQGTNILGGLNAQFGLVTAAGTNAPIVNPPVNVDGMGAVSSSRVAAASLDGSVLFVTGVHGPSAVQPGQLVTRAVSAFPIVKDGLSPVDGLARGVEIESYVNVELPQNFDVVRGATVLDNETFAVALLSATNLVETAIHFVKRDGNPDRERRTSLPVPPGNVTGITASDGFVYVTANVGGEDVAATPRVFVLDPACAL